MKTKPVVVDQGPKLFAIQGRMFKKANNLFKGWLPKHVVLQNKTLKYYNLATKLGQIQPHNKAGEGSGPFGD